MAADACARSALGPTSASKANFSPWKTYPKHEGRGESGSAGALTNSTRARTPRPRTCRGLTLHFHNRLYLCTGEARAQTDMPRRTDGRGAVPALTCPPPPHHQEPDGAPKQNGQQRTCHECSRRHRSHPRRVAGGWSPSAAVTGSSGDVSDYSLTPDSLGTERPDDLRPHDNADVDFSIVSDVDDAISDDEDVAKIGNDVIHKHNVNVESDGDDSSLAECAKLERMIAQLTSAEYSQTNMGDAVPVPLASLF